ncbi:YfjI family protein [uncultured Pontibacter sp.]|uniref:YfjI family protein n=1 Tax=uncultured Pontibacter sp. TaxID=453356 RepID=UPI00260F093D|nr:YfjI family protein [uncultured Pontibacter sp.]
MDRNDLTCSTGNSFPVHAFPQDIQDIIYLLNERLQFPIDFIGAGMLYAASVAIGNTHKVQVKTDWQESAAIYITLVGRPGTNKSHPLSWALTPVFERDSKAYQQYQQEYEKFRQAASLSSKQRKEQGIFEEPAKPALFKHIVQDFTPEALIKVHSQNLRGLGVFADELASWFKNFDRYNKGSEEQFWLSNWSGKTIIIDRKGDNPIRIDTPYVSVCGTIQNGILSDLAKDSRSQNGFIDRILFAMPQDLKKPYPNDLELPQEVTQRWYTYLSNLLDLPLMTDDEGKPQPHVLKFTKQAKAVLNKWMRVNTDLINEAEAESIAGFYTKLEVYLIRLSLILQMLSYTTGDSAREHIEAETVERAILLMEYFRQTGLNVHGILTSTPYDRLTAKQSRIYDLLPDTFHTKEGVTIAFSKGMPEVTFKRFLQRSDLFTKEKHGQYSKKF